MKNPRHLFILLGLVAQGLTWDSYAFLAACLFLWMLAVGRLHNRLGLTLGAESLGLIFGCAGSMIVSRMLGQSWHFFLGDGLVVLQLMRLARPLTKREKLTSLIVACFHFGVLCTLAPNIRFVLLYIAAILLIPGALKETFADSLPDCEPGSSTRLGPFRYVPSMRVSLWLLLGSVFAFVALPRFTGSPLHFREGLGDQGSLLNSVLDPRGGGAANSQQVLMQVEGTSVGYLRCFALSEFDGIRWHSDRSSALYPLPFYTRNDMDYRQNTEPKAFLHRRVFVKNALYLGRMVPVDGRPVYMEQNFFDRPGRSPLSGALEVRSMWTTANNVYEYYIPAQPLAEPLSARLREHLAEHPPQTAALRDWLARATADGTNALHKARLLELHLRKNFRYKLGTPELSRLAPVDDFIFNRKEGHCERFASAMALFLRMLDVPSRVVIGYVGTERNLFTGRLQVRFRDAHSWTEGYFEGKGWLSFDATPGPPEGNDGSNLADMLEALDFIWYSQVVNFNGFAQQEFFSSTAQLFSAISPGGWNRMAWAAIASLVMLLIFRSAKGMKWTWKFRKRARREPAAAARHFYEEMLRALEPRGATRRADQTPREFLEQLRAAAPPAYTDAAVVTQSFCQGFYGGHELTPGQEAETSSALRRLQQPKPPARGSPGHATERI